MKILLSIIILFFYSPLFCYDLRDIKYIQMHTGTDVHPYLDHVSTATFALNGGGGGGSIVYLGGLWKLSNGILEPNTTGSADSLWTYASGIMESK